MVIGIEPGCTITRSAVLSRLVFLIPGLLVLALRIRDNEKLLQEELDGYREYTQKVRYRLAPGMW